MQIVIDVDDDFYARLFSHREDHIADAFDALYIIRNGTPLPKGHGRLLILSEDVVKREQIPLGFSCQSWISEVSLSEAIVAIIEADKCTYKETGCGSCKRQLDCPIEADRAENEV